jgi:hypothetical protein
MARSGQGAGEPPRAGAAAGNRGPAPRPGAPGRGNRVVLGLVVLGMVRHALRNRRFYERVALIVIALASVRGIGQENRATMTARLAAWNKREIERLEHKAERQVGAVKGARRMARSGRPRTAGGQHGR